MNWAEELHDNDGVQNKGVNLTTGEPHYSLNALPSSGVSSIIKCLWGNTLCVTSHGNRQMKYPPNQLHPAALTLLAARKSLIEIISPDILRPLSVSLSLTASVSMEGSLRARRWPGATTFRRGCLCGRWPLLGKQQRQGASSLLSSQLRTCLMTMEMTLKRE